MSKLPTLGILTIYLNDRKAIDERKMFQRMTLAGRKRGLDVFVFTADDVDEARGRIHALVYSPELNTWHRRWRRFPNLIYDRARFQRNSRFERFASFRRRYSHLNFINRPLRNKWVVHKTLEAIPAFRQHLPATRLYGSPADVLSMLKRYSTVYFKPINGTGGRGILRIDRKQDGTLLLQGRNQSRSIIHPRKLQRNQLSAFLKSWDRRGDRYIVQQGLPIQLPGGRVHDYRLLVQKNGSGEWAMTGIAGRVGPARSITSNLHGGGTAAPMHTLLREWVGSRAKIEQIRTTAELLGIEVAKTLERTYGNLCELALDLAIDRNGKVWLLEVNQKPAREVFLRAGEKEVYKRAVLQPIEYALWMYRRNQQRSERRRSSGVSEGKAAAASLHS